MNQPQFAAGPGPKVIDSFKKDGFNILGKDPIPKKQEMEGSREFAELFSLADTKIKDRAHEKPSFELNYTPIQLQQEKNLLSLSSGDNSSNHSSATL